MTGNQLVRHLVPLPLLLFALHACLVIISFPSGPSGGETAVVTFLFFWLDGILGYLAFGLTESLPHFVRLTAIILLGGLQWVGIGFLAQTILRNIFFSSPQELKSDGKRPPERVIRFL